MTIIGEKNIKELVGEIVSNKMNQTCVVLVKSVRVHPIYKKRFVVKKKYYAHNAEDKAVLGDKVKIRLVKPISKLKRRNIVEIV